MSGPLLVVLTVLATARLTLLVTTDRIMQTARRKIAGWRPVEGDATWEGVGVDVELDHVELAARPKLAYLIKCDWCSSFWLSWVPSALAVFWPSNRVVWLVLSSLTSSLIAGIVASLLVLVQAARDRLDAPCGGG